MNHKTINSVNYSTPTKENIINKNTIHSTLSLKKKKASSHDFSKNNNSIKTQCSTNQENSNQKNNNKKEGNKVAPFSLKNSNSMKNLSKNNLKIKSTKNSVKPEKKFNLYEPHITIDPLDIMKKRIQLILDESNEKIADLSLSMSQIDIDSEDSYYKAQNEYSKNLDLIYLEKYNKLREIKFKYDYCLYEIKKIYGEENQELIEEIKDEKENKISEINDDFLIKKNLAKMKFKEKIRQIQQKSICERNNLFEGSFFGEMREKITDILNQPMVTYEIPESINHKEIKKSFIIKDNPNYRGN